MLWVCSAAGGKRTIGLLGSAIVTGGRWNDALVGDIRASVETSRAIDDLLLMTTLGE